MHVISKRPFNDAAKKHPNDATALVDCYKLLCKSQSKTPEDLAQTFTSLDNFKYMDKYYVIDIGGNNLRLIIAIQFVKQRMHVKFIGTHAEYTKFTNRHRK
ncbi:MAG: type II toxin-antitoxin system HigB family toxin [Bermanella sp.]